MKLLSAMEDYFFILLVGFVIGVLFVLKGYEKVEIKTRAAHIRYVLHGVVGSMFITWLGFELFLYLGLPDKLSIALGGLLAYLGTDKVATLFENFIQKKLDIQKCEHERKNDEK